MRSPDPRTTMLALVGALLCPSAVLASSGDGAVSDDDLRIRGVFNSVLPGTERKHALRLTFHPHLGDLIHEDYLRVPLGMRYGLTRQLELTGTVEGYFSHGLGAASFFSESGFDALRLGSKFRLGDTLVPGWDLAVGLDWVRPIGSPPLDLTDGLEHLSPFISFSHPLSGYPNTRVFGSITYDDVTSAHIPGRLDKNELGDDALEFSAGLLHRRGAITYTFEAAVATTRFTGRIEKDTFMIRPGLIWLVPERYTFSGRGRWLLGASVRGGYGPDGMDVGAGLKLRINFDLKRLMGRHRAAPPP